MKKKRIWFFSWIGMLFCLSDLFAHPMKNIPKAELHLHLGGAYPLDYVLSIASEMQKVELLGHLESLSKGINYPECLKIFPVIAGIVNSEGKVEAGTEALCQSLHDDGVIYVEIRTGLKNLGQGYEEYLRSVIRGMSRCTSLGVNAKLLLSLQRASSLEMAKMTVDLALQYQRDGIVGIDLSGDSTSGEVSAITSEILRAKQNNLFLTVHLGESPRESQQIELLRTLQPHRIGHGVHLSTEAKSWVLEHKIPLEVCLTSSQKAKMLEDPSQHPGFDFFKAGHPITIATDDPLIFRSSLSDEYALFQQIAGLSDEEMCQIALRSMDYTFVSEAKREPLKETF